MNANTIALITLFATVAGLAVALFTHRRSLERGELSKVRDNLIERLENLTDEAHLKDEKFPFVEREIIFQMHTKIIELDIKKYKVTARRLENIDFETPLEALVFFEAKDIPAKRSLFRQRCYKLLKEVDKAYYQEIKTTSWVQKAKVYYYEVSGIAMSLLAIALTFYILKTAIFD